MLPHLASVLTIRYNTRVPLEPLLHLDGPLTIPLILLAIGKLIVEFMNLSLRSLYTGEMFIYPFIGLKMHILDAGKIHWNLSVLFFSKLHNCK